MKTRRQFLNSSLMGAAVTWTIPSFLNQTLLAMDLQAANSNQPATGRDHPILVVIQLSGGNDGLNCVVPYADDAYYKARPSLAHKKDSILKINDYFGFCPDYTGLKSLFDEGHLAVVNGVGYPNPNRSHFRSMDIWHTASDSDKNLARGWIGRYFDNTCNGVQPDVGINIGNAHPLAFIGDNPNGISMANPNAYRLLQDPDQLTDNDAAMQGMMGAEDNSAAGASIANLGSTMPGNHGQNPLDYLERTTLDAEISSDHIRALIARQKPTGEYPSTRLANDLRLIAQLIAGGMDTRVYYAHQGGYDTHANQAGAHPRLTREFSDALAAFCKDLQGHKALDRVLVVTFSEFGRRVQQNASGGTDHGVAGPMFIAGGGVKAGTYGQYPSLTELNKGDLVHNVDFRSVYATILQRWLKTDPAPILGRSFPTLDFV